VIYSEKVLLPPLHITLGFINNFINTLWTGDQNGNGFLSLKLKFLRISYGLDGPGSIPGNVRFSLLHSVQTDSGAYPASYPIGTRGSFPGVKQPGREADHSPPSSAEVKNT
jgi:hypothetical protein